MYNNQDYFCFVGSEGHGIAVSADYDFYEDVTNGGDTNHCALENDGTSYCY